MDRTKFEMDFSCVKTFIPCLTAVTLQSRRIIMRRLAAESTEFENGHEYYAEHGKIIALPDNPALRPAAEFLAWHNDNVYLG
jgi:hypothetical protein